MIFLCILKFNYYVFFQIVIKYNIFQPLFHTHCFSTCYYESRNVKYRRYIKQGNEIEMFICILNVLPSSFYYYYYLFLNFRINFDEKYL